MFVDESKRRDYLLVASVHVGTEVAQLRGVVRELLLPNQRFLHMKNERDSRKRQIAAALVAAGVQATVYRAGQGYDTEKQRRRACLEALVKDCADGSHTVVTLDQDESLSRWDNQQLIELVRAAGCRETMQYQHAPARSELLLAVPDAIAWCWAKGGRWRQLIAAAVTEVREV